MRAGDKCDIDTVVDEQGHAMRPQHGHDIARLLDHGARRTMLVAQLHQRRAFREQRREAG